MCTVGQSIDKHIVIKVVCASPSMDVEVDWEPETGQNKSGGRKWRSTLNVREIVRGPESDCQL